MDHMRISGSEPSSVILSVNVSYRMYFELNETFGLVLWGVLIATAELYSKMYSF